MTSAVFHIMSGVVASLPQIAPEFPYLFSLLSVDNTGTAGDWTTAIGSGLTAGSGTLWVMDASDDRARYYQELPALASQYGTIDAGNARIDLDHIIETFTDDDDALAFVEFLDGSDNFLGREFTEQTNATGPVTLALPDIVVPSGTRKFHIGWQGYRYTGSQLSAYVRDITANMRLVSEVVDSVVVWSEAEASKTGWTDQTGTMLVATTAADDWQQRADRDAYTGGSAESYTRASRSFSLPAGWATKIANGNVFVRATASLFNANADDDVGFGIEFDQTGTNTSIKTGRIVIVNSIVGGLIETHVPTDTNNIILDFEFWRDDGTYNDGAISQPSIILYELGADSDYASVEFLSGFEAADGDTAFVNEKTAASLTNTGTPVAKYENSMIGTSAVALNEGGGSGDYFNLGSPASSNMDFGAGDFTIEGFARSTVNDSTFFHSILGNFNGSNPGSWSLFVENDTDNNMTFIIAGVDNLLATTDVGLDAFHFAVSRNGGTGRLFVNGVMEAKVTTWSTSTIEGTGDVIIGGNQAGSNDHWRGHIGELRITKGVGRYNSDDDILVPKRPYPRA